MSKVKPKYVSQVPYVPLSIRDAEILVGQALHILEAVMPEGQQLDRTKSLMKSALYKHFTGAFQGQYNYLVGDDAQNSTKNQYYDAMWEAAQNDGSNNI